MMSNEHKPNVVDGIVQDREIADETMSNESSEVLREIQLNFRSLVPDFKLAGELVRAHLPSSWIQNRRNLTAEIDESSRPSEPEAVRVPKPRKSKRQLQSYSTAEPEADNRGLSTPKITGRKIPLPLGWRGNPPAKAILTVEDTLDYLREHCRRWREIAKSYEIPQGFSKFVAEAIHNTFCSLVELDFPVRAIERPAPTTDHIQAAIDVEKLIHAIKSRLAGDAMAPNAAILTPRQTKFMDFLTGGNTITQRLAAKRMKIKESVLQRDVIKPLKELGRVKNARRVGGYYRTDDPPPEMRQ